MESVALDRKKRNILSAWWWTIDRLVLFAIMAVIALGAVMVATASPAIAEKIGLGTFYFVKRQMVFLVVAVAMIIGLSMLSSRSVKRLALVGFPIGIMLLLAVLLTGEEAKGAKRWLYIVGFSLQPSEFVKPLFIIITAWMLAEAKTWVRVNGYKLSVALYALLVALLVLQPDFGMVIVVSAVYMGQLFLAGIPLYIISVFMALGCIGILSAYAFFPHVKFRIDSFIDSFTGGGNFQVKKSLEAFHGGGFFGKGPGEGTVKQHLPDSHTDFVFAVAGEELGALMCITVVVLYGFIVVRGLARMLKEEDVFTIYAVAGLLMQFGIQAIVNMGVALNLLPTKGMTLPFVSYGGSSMLAMAMTMGMMLALTRRRYGNWLRVTPFIVPVAGRIKSG